MYTKPIFYKAYSIVMTVVSVLLFLGSVVSLFAVPSNILGGVKNVPFGLAGSVEALETLFLIFKITMAVTTIVSLFFVYMDVSSVYTFARMIEHEQSGAKTPFVKPSFALSAKGYRRFGTFMFSLCAIMSIVSISYLVISYSISQSAIIAVPLIPVAVNVVILFINYITYYCRYKSFADVLDIVSKDEPGAPELDNLKEDNSGLLRGFCAFLFIITMIVIIATIVGVIIISGPVIKAAGGALFGLLAFGTCVLSALYVLALCVIGCFYDNLAKMIEHYQIKHKIL